MIFSFLDDHISPKAPSVSVDNAVKVTEKDFFDQAHGGARKRFKRLIDH